MINQELLNYIDQELKLAVPPATIIENLTAQGWQQADINEAFRQTTINSVSTQTEEQNPNTENKKNNGKATAGLVLGLIGLIAWFIPLFGAPIAITGLVLSIIGIKSEKQTKAIVGTILCSLALIATVINALLGAYLGITGQHSVVNKYFGETEQQVTDQNLLPTTPTVGSDTIKAEYISQAVESIKIEMDLPQQIDEYTTIVDITAEPSAVRYHYVVAGVDTNLITNKILKEGLLGRVCKDENIKAILNEDVNMEYSFSVQDSPQKYFVFFTKNDCQ